MLKIIKISVGIIVTIVAIAFIVTKFDFDSVTKTIKNYRYEYLFYALIPLFLGVFIRALRWFMLLRLMHSEAKFSAVCYIFTASQALNNLLPLRAGDVARVSLFTKDLGVPSSKLLGSLIFERMLDVFCIISVAGIFVLFIDIGKAWEAWLVTIAISISLTIMVVALFAGVFARILRKIQSFSFLDFKILHILFDFIYDTLISLKFFSKPKIILTQSLIGIIGWIIEFQLFSLVAAGAKAATVATGIYAGVGAAIISMVPASPGAFGSFHLGAIQGYLIALKDINFSEASVLAFISHLIIWGSITLAGGIAMIFLSKVKKPAAIALLPIVLLFSANAQAADNRFVVEKFAGPFDHPWAISWLDDGRSIVSERVGRLRIVSPAGDVSSAVEGLPRIAAAGQGGLLDVQINPKKKDQIYFCYSKPNNFEVTTAVARATLAIKNGSTYYLKNLDDIFITNTSTLKSYHFGCRIRFDQDNNLVMATGERGNGKNSQNPRQHAGSIIKMTATGSPYKRSVKNQWLPHIFAIGVRNPQGLFIREKDNAIIAHEHGAQGGDELNLIEEGKNYGWPVITHGEQYGGGKIGEGTAKEGMEQPLKYWVPSIAPSGMVEYTGFAFPDWRHNIFLGALKDRMLVRLTMQGNRVVNEERLLKNKLGRIRDVAQGPDGYIYILTDSIDGYVYRLKPNK